MAAASTLKRIDALAWALIFGGLLVLVLGLATRDEAVIAGWSLTALGGIAAAAGVVLIVVRSRLRETPEPGAQSTAQETRK